MLADLDLAQQVLEALSFLTSTYREYARMRGSNVGGRGQALLSCVDTIFHKRRFGDVSKDLHLPHYMMVEVAVLQMLELLDKKQPHDIYKGFAQVDSHVPAADFQGEVLLRLVREVARKTEDLDSFRQGLCQLVQPLDGRRLVVQSGQAQVELLPDLDIEQDSFDIWLEEAVGDHDTPVCQADCPKPADDEPLAPPPDVAASQVDQEVVKVLIKLRNLCAPSLATEEELEEALAFCQDTEGKTEGPLLGSSAAAAGGSDSNGVLLMALRGTLSLPLVAKARQAARERLNKYKFWAQQVEQARESMALLESRHRAAAALQVRLLADCASGAMGDATVRARAADELVAAVGSGTLPAVALAVKTFAFLQEAVSECAEDGLKPKLEEHAHVKCLEALCNNHLNLLAELAWGPEPVVVTALHAMVPAM